LVQLESFNRWFSIIFFGFLTLIFTWRAFGLLESVVGSLRFRAALIFLTIDGLNIASIWYLARRSFRKFAVEFVAEREREKRSRMLQKASQEALAKEIKSHK
jgi:hypothetical protein